MSDKYGFDRRLLIAMDAKGYGAADDQIQGDIQTGLLAAADAAAVRCGLDRATWETQPGGDGELAVLPVGQQGLEPRIVDDYLPRFAAALADHNHVRRPESRLRVRVAVHYGVAMLGSNGFVGQGVVAVSRLVDSDPLRAAITEVPEVDLAIMLSDQIFADTVAQRNSALRSKDFRRVDVRKKEFDEHAWLYVYGHDVHALTLRTAAQTPPAAASEPNVPQRESVTQNPVTAQVVNQFNNTVNAERGIFGISHSRD